MSRVGGTVLRLYSHCSVFFGDTRTNMRGGVCKKKKKVNKDKGPLCVFLWFV